jgi:multicomponent K+:H+ antiporter subunit A
MFWEGTSVASFLLIGFKGKAPKARAGAMQSLLITGLGGVALLLGVILIVAVVGSTDIEAVRQSGDLLRSHGWYPWIVGLIVLGVFTKSAQALLHIWLPNGMTAPTPASAFLHLARMVKAGIYLLAKLNPAFGFTELWFWPLTLPGLTTMMLGAYLGMVARDL